jgi:uncharacterized protein YaiL (DUF2058 family)
MANAFQKELLKAGLVSKDKLNKANKSRHKQAKQQPKNKTTETEELKQQVKQAALEKAERDRELNRQKAEADNKKAIVAQIRQLVDMNRIVIDSEADEAEAIYNFEDDSKIKQVYVTEPLRQQIVNGRLAIVRMNEKYEIVPIGVADKITQRDASFVVVCNETTANDDSSADDDEYADFKVPDDLMW